MEWIKNAEATPIELREEIRALEREVRMDTGGMHIDLPSEDSFMDGLKPAQINELKGAKEQLAKIITEIEKYKNIEISL